MPHDSLSLLYSVASIDRLDLVAHKYYGVDLIIAVHKDKSLGYFWLQHA